MKLCSKCKVEQPLDQFVKSDAYKDKRHPHCKTCRKKNRAAWLLKTTLCKTCGVNPHSINSPYCEPCQRIARGRDPEVKYHRQPNGSTTCPRCGIREKAKDHGYCDECQREYAKSLAVKAGGWWNTLSAEQKIRAIARAKVGMRIRRGKMKRLPCEICGAEPSEFHHYAGYSKENTYKGAFLCKIKHHPEADAGIIKVDRDGDGRLVVTSGEAGIA